MEQKPTQPLKFTWKTIAGMALITAITIVIFALLANLFNASNPSLWTTIGAGLGAALGVIIMTRLANR
jgi:hypothetical protein